MAAHLSDSRFASFSYRQEHYPEVQTIVECFFLIHEADTAFKEGQRRGLPIAVITSPEELLEDEHEKARNFFVEVDHGDAGMIRYPGPPFRFSAMETASRTRAPQLGEHDEELGG
jgi:crotonobetainyl-CoA:carnitine CoA-transferase CaiB-like acyl-CoA transferase